MGRNLAFRAPFWAGPPRSCSGMAALDGLRSSTITGCWFLKQQIWYLWSRYRVTIITIKQIKKELVLHSMRCMLQCEASISLDEDSIPLDPLIRGLFALLHMTLTNRNEVPLRHLAPAHCQAGAGE